ncbi:enoyl-CoA hydratase-related protein, partial [Bradyrhizobium sp.]|uniref:enoyl-CoA hydratase-related protein n=1 Tax=Bradyrhizobium sp. TaxID=376 RepID=UPI00391D43CE
NQGRLVNGVQMPKNERWVLVDPDKAWATQESIDSLTRAIGKAKAMDLCLTGRMMDAAEAERSGLVSRVVAADRLMEETMAAAEKIASMSRPAAAMAKEAVNRAFETPLSEGMNVERNLFHATFALEDRAEGMAAFIEKRKPVNKNR